MNFQIGDRVRFRFVDRYDFTATVYDYYKKGDKEGVWIIPDEDGVADRQWSRHKNEPRAFATLYEHLTLVDPIEEIEIEETEFFEILKI